ncbi:MAG: OsmC family protein [Chitinophagaceae bacterium]|nr:OsmC family protein [Chitinophagaceae bacterium]MBK9484246.1 OsmC family protein [Chitinophagaceae bacterium]
METAYHYEVKVNWEADRKGSMSSPVLNTKIEVATPPEFPKGMPGIWSPEHLLVAAVNSCLMTTFLAIAENFKFDFIDFESKADGTLEKVDGKFMMNEVILSPVLTIAPDADKEKALRILEKSEAACLISNSVKAKIVFKPEIKITELVEPV